MGTHRGRRDNGLVASEYAIAGDVDPRIGEHLLDVLAAGGIAAYLQPTADVHPITRTTTMPDRPTDRLFVDRAHLGTAREQLAQLDVPVAAGSAVEAKAEADMDAAWARIVADLERDRPWPDDGQDRPDGRDGPVGSDRADGPDRADAPDRRDRPDAPGAGHPPTLPTRERVADEPSLLDGLDTFGADLPDEEGSYEPPPPPPLPRLSKAAVASLLAVIAGFVLFIWPSLAPIDPGLTRLVGFVACFAGVAGLVWRLRPGTDEDDDPNPDDGAVV